MTNENPAPINQTQELQKNFWQKLKLWQKIGLFISLFIILFVLILFLLPSDWNITPALKNMRYCQQDSECVAVPGICRSQSDIPKAERTSEECDPPTAINKKHKDNWYKRTGDVVFKESDYNPECVNNRCVLSNKNLINEEGEKILELERLYCQQNNNCIAVGNYSNCCSECGEEVINKITAEKEMSERKKKCDEKSNELCPMFKCLRFSLTPVCRENICMAEEDYIISQAIINKNAENCEQEKNDFFKTECYYNMALILGNKDLCKKVTTYYNQSVCEIKVQETIDNFSQCKSKVGELKDKCYLNYMQGAWAPYYKIKSFCIQAKNFNQCLIEFIKNYF